MNVLVACEFSGVVRDAFIARGHDAISCDFLPSEKPGPHIEGNVLMLLQLPWDLVIAHPPCTYTANSGVRFLHERPARWQDLDRACDFFRECLGANSQRVAVENPVPHRYAIERIGRKYDFKIQPFEFGHEESKQTCFWVKGLPPLLPTKWGAKTDRSANWYHSFSSKIASRERSRTFRGVADAMATQWGGMPPCS